MHVDKFKNILKKFLLTFDCVKSLCKEIQVILFPLLKSEALFTETSSDSSKDLYNFIIEVFDNAIVGMI